MPEAHPTDRRTSNQVCSKVRVVQRPSVGGGGQLAVFRLLSAMAKARLIFGKPEPASIVIYDATGSEELRLLISGRAESRILYTRLEELRVSPSIVYWLLRFRFQRARWSSAYFAACVRSRAPQLLLTFIDNDPRFYEVAEFCPDVPAVAIQNGNRFPYLEGVLPLDRSYPAHLVAFGEFDRSEYLASYTTFQSVHIGGSLRSALSMPTESEQVSNSRDIADICLVSSSWDAREGIWFEEGEVVCRWVSTWLVENPTSTLVVALRSAFSDTANLDAEVAYYSAHFGTKHKFLPRRDFRSTYQIMDAVRVTVCAGTTSGLENLARGNRTLQCNPLRDESELLPIRSVWYLPRGEYSTFASRLNTVLAMSDDEFRMRADSTGALLQARPSLDLMWRVVATLGGLATS